ncbi:hypothetical protein ODU39_08695, partial [Streptococcus sp. 2021WUSS126]
MAHLASSLPNNCILTTYYSTKEGFSPNVIKLTNLSHFVVGYFLCYTKNKRGKVMLDQIKVH